MNHNSVQLRQMEQPLIFRLIVCVCTVHVVQKCVHIVSRYLKKIWLTKIKCVAFSVLHNVDADERYLCIAF